jgi:hypothetical protein
MAEYKIEGTESERAAMRLVTGVAALIRELGAARESELWKLVQSETDVTTFREAIRLLTDRGVVRKGNRVLTWVGPRLKERAKEWLDVPPEKEWYGKEVDSVNGKTRAWRARDARERGSK